MHDPDVHLSLHEHRIRHVPQARFGPPAGAAPRRVARLWSFLLRRTSRRRGEPTPSRDSILGA